jgi:hypothetical protein
LPLLLKLCHPEYLDCPTACFQFWPTHFFTACLHKFLWYYESMPLYWYSCYCWSKRIETFDLFEISLQGG